MPDVMCREGIDSGALTRLELDWQCPPLLTSATYLARDYAPRKIRTFIDYLADRLHDQVGGPTSG
jgi:DNA-binding transcriptional LysR family regulator